MNGGNERSSDRLRRVRKILAVLHGDDLGRNTDGDLFRSSAVYREADGRSDMVEQ